MVLLVSRIKPTGKVHRLWRNYWERGRPGWPQSGEQRWLSAGHGPRPALLAGSPSPPAPLASPHGTPAGTVTHAPPGRFSLRSIPGLKWMNIFCQTLPCKSKGHQPDAEHHFASNLSCVGGDLPEQSSAGRFLGSHQRKRAFTNKTLPLPN